MQSVNLHILKKFLRTLRIGNLVTKNMDLSGLSKKLGLLDSKLVIPKAAELRRLCDVQFDSSITGVGEVCKAVVCLEIAATRTKLDVRELAIRFGCIRIISFVRNGLNLYKGRFLSSLPSSRRASADFTRPVFTAVAFYLCAKKHKLKLDKLKLIELCGTSESEFSSVATSMKDLCHDVFGIAKEKEDPREVKSNQGLFDVLSRKRKSEDGGYLSYNGPELLSYKIRKQTEKHDYQDRKSSLLPFNNNQDKPEVSRKRATKQTRLNFQQEAPENQRLEAM